MGAIRKARQLADDKRLSNQVNFVKGSCEGLPFKNAFDIVLGVAILHHLDLDPFINLFRLLTPNRRTVDEQPLTMETFLLLKNNFSDVRIHGYHLLALLSYPFFVLKAYKIFRFLLKILSKADDQLFEFFPGAQKYCWGVLIEIES